MQQSTKCLSLSQQTSDSDTIFLVAQASGLHRYAKLNCKTCNKEKVLTILRSGIIADVAKTGGLSRAFCLRRRARSVLSMIPSDFRLADR
jgi:hypothetical protein